MMANLLGVQGVRTLLIERNATIVQQPRAVSIDDEALRTMQAAGRRQRGADAGRARLRLTLLLADAHPFRRTGPTGHPYGYPRRNAFRQPPLEEQLKDALGRFGNIDTL
jgi:3-(3-hydroxy-phenyl)propionate hydroxylase